MRFKCIDLESTIYCCEFRSIFDDFHLRGNKLHGSKYVFIAVKTRDPRAFAWFDGVQLIAKRKERPTDKLSR